MRDVFRYLTDCRYIWLWGLLSGTVYAVVFGLYGIRWEVIWYPLLLAAAFGLFFLALGFRRYRKKHRELERLDPAEAPCADYLPRAGSLTERDYQELVRKRRMRTGCRRKNGTLPAGT